MRNHPVGFYKIIAIAEDKDITRGLYRPHIAGVAGSGTLGCIYYPQGIGGTVAFDHGASVIGTAVIAHEYLKTGVTCLNGEGIKILIQAQKTFTYNGESIDEFKKGGRLELGTATAWPFVGKG